MMILVEAEHLVKAMLSQVMRLLHLEIRVSLKDKHFFLIAMHSNHVEYHNAESGSGTGTRQGRKLVITDEYFQRVTQSLILHLRQHEDTVAQDGM